MAAVPTYTCPLVLDPFLFFCPGPWLGRFRSFRTNPHGCCSYMGLFSLVPFYNSIGGGSVSELFGSISDSTNRYNCPSSQVPGLDDFVVFELTRMVVMLLVAHMAGALHHWSHGRDLWRHLLLEARQRAVMRCIEEETASCDRWGNSIVHIRIYIYIYT